MNSNNTIVKTFTFIGMVEPNASKASQKTTFFQGYVPDVVGSFW